jgi:GT2 family glycosyltransferase
LPEATVSGVDMSLEWRGPMAMVDVDVDDLAPEVAVSAHYTRARLLLRDGGRLVGVVGEVPLTQGNASATDVRAAVVGARPKTGWPMPAAAARSLPSVTVAVCTRGRGDRVMATIDAFENLRYGRPIDIVVVENAPENGELKAALEARPPRADRRVRYVVEPIGGLSRARNRATAVAHGEVIAFTDDDAIPEPNWLEALVAGFQIDPRVGAAGGLTLAAELETQAQEWYENFDGFNRGRGLEAMMFTPGDPDTHPLYPIPLRFAGVNMAFSRELLIQLGGFSPLLGAGTGTGGAEDVAIAAEVLLHGRFIAYEPAAVVRHYHRRSETDLVKMMSGYGSGTTAYLLWCLHHHPLRSLGMAKMVPPALRYFLTRGKSHESEGQGPVPAHLTGALRKSMLDGPMSYIRSVRDGRQTGLPAPPP